MVGKMGFEPTTSWSRTKRATKLRYFPIKNQITITDQSRQAYRAHPF